MRLNHITLIVTDFDRSTAFYRSLGLVAVVYEPPRYARFRCPDSDETLSIEVTEESSTPARVQIFFECPDPDHTVTQLKPQGLNFDQDSTDMPYLWREARIRDPDGHDIRLYFAGKNT